jgi:glutamine amidotransferase
MRHSTEPANRSAAAKDLAESNPEVCCAFAHIRMATMGHVDLVNCHPFSAYDSGGRRWVMQHKGTMFDSPRLDPYLRRQSGGTDSERMLLYIIDCMNDAASALGREPVFDERFGVLTEIVRDLSPNNAFAILLHDGDYLYAHSNYHVALNRLERDGLTLLSTERLDAGGRLFGDGAWETFPICSLHAYRDGRLVAKAVPHDFEYIYDEADMLDLYRDFSAL